MCIKGNVKMRRTALTTLCVIVMLTQDFSALAVRAHSSVNINEALLPLSIFTAQLKRHLCRNIKMILKFSVGDRPCSFLYNCCHLPMSTVVHVRSSWFVRISENAT